MLNSLTQKLCPGKQPPKNLKMKILPAPRADLMPHVARDTNTQKIYCCILRVFWGHLLVWVLPYFLPQLPLPPEVVRINYTARINYILAEDSPEYGNKH